MGELKPCPFCGCEKARLIGKHEPGSTRIRFIGDYRLYTEGRRYYAKCNRCHAHSGSVSGNIVKSFTIYKGFHLDERSVDRLFVDDYDNPFEGPEKRKKPELPDWVSTEEQIKERAAAIWNRRPE